MLEAVNRDPKHHQLARDVMLDLMPYDHEYPLVIASWYSNHSNCPEVGSDQIFLQSTKHDVFSMN